jgi:ABC-type multidrug transport system fused ATPase/permease subunit
MNEIYIRALAQENTNFIESARAIQSIKLFNRETDRESQWFNLHADTVNASIRTGSRLDSIWDDELRDLRLRERRDRLSGSHAGALVCLPSRP